MGTLELCAIVGAQSEGTPPANMPVMRMIGLRRSGPSPALRAQTPNARSAGSLGAVTAGDEPAVRTPDAARRESSNQKLGSRRLRIPEPRASASGFARERTIRRRGPAALPRDDERFVKPLADARGSVGPFLEGSSHLPQRRESCCWSGSGGQGWTVRKAPASVAPTPNSRLAITRGESDIHRERK